MSRSLIIICISVVALAVLGALSFRDSATPCELKGGPVTASGYVDLAAPVTYSPARGIVCENTSTDQNNAALGRCYGTSGPSVELTGEYLSTPAAQALRAKLASGQHEPTDKFTMLTGIVCDQTARRCWCDATLTTSAPRHTKALWFPAE